MTSADADAFQAPPSSSRTNSIANSPHIVLVLPPRTILHPAGQVGKSDQGGIIDNIALPPSTQYYLDFTLTFGPQFDWDGKRQSGKIPGLAGGKGTGGRRHIEADGWSARQVFGPSGAMASYIYHQDRKSKGGDKLDWRNSDGTPFHFIKGKEYRVTQRIKVNIPDAFDGENQIWVNGLEVFSKNDVRFRGNIHLFNALVSQLKFHSYFGGGSRSAPTYDSFISYGSIYVMSCAPDFGLPPGSCR